MAERLARSTAFRLAIFAVLALILVWPLLPQAAWTNEFRDAQVLGLHERAAATTVSRFHELPLWDPYYCGGLYALGAPQSRFASPAFLATLLVGVERAQPLLIFLLTVLGMEGTYRWLRLRVSSPSAAFFIAPVFALSGHFAVAVYRGWTTFFGFQLLPLLLLGVTLAARGRARGIVIAAAAFAFILGFGGTFAAPLVALAAIAEAGRAWLELPRDRRLRAVAMLLAVALFMATLSAVRLWPVAETLASSPRIMAGTPGHLPKHLFAFVWKSLEVKDGDVEGAGSFYVGPLFLVLVALGGADRKSFRPLVLLVLFLWLAAGYARNPPLFALLRRLPVFSALRYPERFLWISILFACEPAAIGLSRIPRLGDTARWRRGATVVLSLAAMLTVGLQLVNFFRVASARPLAALVETPADRFRQTRGNRWLAAHYDGIGLGSLSCWETHPVVMSPLLRADLEAEEYVLGSGSVERRAWSPNRIALHASLLAPSRVVVNQNWHPGWRSTKGEVVSEEGLLAVKLPEGAHDVELAFRPVSAWGGALVSGVALFALIVLATRRRMPFARGNVLASAAIALAPVAVFAVVQKTRTEPPFPPPPLRNPNGEAALVETTQGAPAVSATFALPVALEAARISPVDSLANVRIDLYLRRKGPLGKNSSLFVHLERREDQPPAPIEGEKKETFVNRDHQVVGGSFYLSDAPLGALVHDSFGAHLGKGLRGVWDVKVGFGVLEGRKAKSTDLVTIGTINVP